MPRTKANPDELYIRELRITPPDGQPITDWQITDKDFKQVIAAQEGGEDQVRLHYHVYIETMRSASWITKWIYSIAHCYNGEQGNSVFFSRKPHDNTIGYVVKHGNIVVRHGTTDTFIDEWLAKSDQYRRDKEADRARNKRLKKSFTQQVRNKVSEILRQSPDTHSPQRVLDLIIECYHEANQVFPSRTQVENLIVTLLYPYDKSLHRAFYLRSFETHY